MNLKSIGSTSQHKVEGVVDKRTRSKIDVKNSRASGGVTLKMGCSSASGNIGV
jgi:hypothetical protein